MRTLVTERHRLSVWRAGPSGWGELYDFDEDPDELANRWDDPGAAPLRAELTEQLLEQMIALQSSAPLPSGLA